MFCLLRVNHGFDCTEEGSSKCPAALHLESFPRPSPPTARHTLHRSFSHPALFGSMSQSLHKSGDTLHELEIMSISRGITALDGRRSITSSDERYQSQQGLQKLQISGGLYHIFVSVVLRLLSSGSTRNTHSPKERVGRPQPKVRCRFLLLLAT